MFEAYSVSVTLKLNNLVSPQLALLAKEMERLEGLSVALRASFRGLGAEVAGVRAITTATNATNRALERASVSAATLQGHLAAMRATAAAIPPIAPHLGAGGPRIPVTPGVVPPGGPYGGGRGGGGAGGRGGAAQQPGGFHGGNIHMGPGGIGFGGIGMAAGNGFVPLAMTAGGIWGAHTLYEAARDYETTFTRFKTLNLGAEVNKQANDFARGTRLMGVSSKDLMETLRESVGMFGGMPNALKVAPILAQLNAANSNLFGGKIGAIDEGAARSLMRFNDMRGLTDSPEDFMRGLNLAQRIVTGSGGALKFTDLEQMARRGGAAFKGLSDDGIMMLSTLAQEQGGAATGTALMSLYQNLVAGRTTKKTMAALSEAGLVTLGSVTSGAVGDKKTTSTQIVSIKDEKLLRENPGAWLMKYGTEAAKASGAKSDSEIVAFMNKLVSNRTGSNMAANFTTQGLQAMRDFNLSKNAMGAQETIAASQKTLAGKEQEFLAAWTDFKTTAGTQLLPAFSNFLTNSAAFLRGVESFMAKNAALISAIGTGATWLQKLSPTAPLTGLLQTGLQAIRGGSTGGATGSWGGETIRGGGNKPVQVNSTINMDGRAVAKSVTTHQAAAVSQPATGSRRFDGSMQPQGSW